MRLRRQLTRRAARACFRIPSKRLLAWESRFYRRRGARLEGFAFSTAKIQGRRTFRQDPPSVYAGQRSIRKWWTTRQTAEFLSFGGRMSRDSTARECFSTELRCMLGGSLARTERIHSFGGGSASIVPFALHSGLRIGATTGCVRGRIASKSIGARDCRRTLRRLVRWKSAPL